MQQNLPIVTIVGKPNVGKSSLFNRILRKRNAIVAKEPGTTRDALQDVVTYADKNFWLLDTAGLQTKAEQLFSATPREFINDINRQIDDSLKISSIILLIVDGSTLLGQDEKRIIKNLKQAGSKFILVVNKIDKTKNEVPAEFYKLGIESVVGVSAKSGVGVEALLSSLSELLPVIKLKTNPNPTIVICGRPNVGKSSMVNSLSGTPSIITSENAGTTIDAVKRIAKWKDKEFQIIDTGGIRKPGKRSGIEGFSYLRTADALSYADVAVLVLDARKIIARGDKRIAGLIKNSGVGLIIAINKWDLVEDKENARNRIEKRLERELAFAWWSPIIYTSATAPKNLDKIYKLAIEIQKTRSSEYSPDELAELLSNVLKHRPPSGNPRPILKNLTQIGGNPPEFEINGKFVDGLHFSYRRYIEKQLYKGLEIIGTPIKITYRNKP